MTDENTKQVERKPSIPITDPRFKYVPSTLTDLRKRPDWPKPREHTMQKQNGFTLIELMIVVAILAILAAIALPAYQDYTIRAKVTELALAASACKTSITEYYQSQNGWPPNQAASGCGDQDTQYVDKLVVGNNGTIVVTARTGVGAIDVKAAGDLALVPSVSATGHLNWSCSDALTTIPKKYLPALCR